MLKKKERLTAEDIQSLSEPGAAKSAFGALLSLRFSPASAKRISIVVPKKVASRAVDRTRLRRRLYAAVEKPFGRAIAAHIMLIPKKECLSAPFADLARDAEAVFAKARLLSQ